MGIVYSAQPRLPHVEMSDKKPDTESQSGSIISPKGFGASQSWSSDEAMGDEAPKTTGERSNNQPEDRTGLLQQARDFLASPAIRSRNVSSKRAFLESNGLTHAEVDSLIYELTVGHIR